MSTLTEVNSKGQLRGQEQPQRQGQAQIQRTSQCPGQTRVQRETNGPDKPVNFHGNILEQRSERLLMTVRSDGQTVPYDQPSDVSLQSTERPLGRGAFGEVW